MAASATHSKTLRKSALPSSAYVLSLASLPTYYAAAASEPTNKIYLLDKSTLQSHELGEHQKAITDLRIVQSLGSSSGPTLLSSGKDRVVCAWDERANSRIPSMQMRLNRPQELLCCDASYDGRLIASGTDLKGNDALLVYWDPRQPGEPIRMHSETHSEDITAVHFHPSAQESRILSASSDGLLCTSNPNESDEDEAVHHVGSWGCSVAQVGWIGDADASTPSVWAASDMETFSTWSQELDKLSDIDARQSWSSPSHSQNWSTDYLISASSSATRGFLDLFLGNNEGGLANATCATNTDTGVNGQGTFSVSHVWSGGHSGIVRSVLHDKDAGILVSGGEDANICLWRYAHDASEEQSMEVDDSDFMPNESRKRQYRERGEKVEDAVNAIWTVEMHSGA